MQGHLNPGLGGRTVDAIIGPDGAAAFQEVTPHFCLHALLLLAADNNLSTCVMYTAWLSAHVFLAAFSNVKTPLRCA